MRDLAKDPQLILNKDYQNAVIQAFQSNEYAQLEHFIVKTFVKIDDKQLNNILRRLFKEQAEQDPWPLVKKLMNLFTLQKIEAIIRTEFSLFTSVSDTASSMVNKVRQDYEAMTEFVTLLKKRTQEKQANNIAAMKISEESTENNKKQFILLAHYLQLALDETVKELTSDDATALASPLSEAMEERRKQIKVDSTLISLNLVREVIESEKQKILAEAKAKEEERLARDEAKFAEELKQAQRQKKIKECLGHDLGK